MECKLAVDVKCNWECNMVDKKVEDILVINENVPPESEISADPGDIMTYETSVNFVTPEEESVMPEITLNVKKHFENVYIERVELACEHRTVEIFGDCDMYLQTKVGEYLDTGIYKIITEFADPIKSCRIKFICKENVKNFWIYGVHVFIIKSKVIKDNTINLSNVEKLIKDGHISEKAQMFLDFLKKSNRSAVQDEKKYLQSSQVNSDLKLAESIVEIKAYIDQKFKNLEDLLTAQEQRLNDRLNTILETIQLKN